LVLLPQTRVFGGCGIEQWSFSAANRAFVCADLTEFRPTRT
jgi:hypothetical protein